MGLSGVRRLESVAWPAAVLSLAKRCQVRGFRLVLVGGIVRDALLGRDLGDVDAEVYGTSGIDDLASFLASVGDVDFKGEPFLVLALSFEGCLFDLALPREDVKVSDGHFGFKASFRPDFTFEDAARRRDFTVNAMGYDVLTGEFFDPFNGLADLDAKVLRHIDERFSEDPERAHRAARFSKRLGFELADETADLCAKMSAA